MSRSYKKPWVKDPANSYMKRIHARKMRRITRSVCHVFNKEYDPLWEDNEEKPLEPEIPHRKVVSNMYDICDYIFEDKSPKGTRK